MSDGWVPALAILISFSLFLGLCFGLMYLIGWLVKRRKNNNDSN